jgi:transcriptional regulator with XRE-family HTH domain
VVLRPGAATLPGMAKKPDPLALFGRRVRDLREQAGYSQEGFALRHGIDRSYYGAVERGRKNVCLLSAVKIADALGVPLLELFRWK